jgi:hypothetical protein
MDRKAVVAGVRWTVVPSGRVIWWMESAGSAPEAKADARTPATRMKTAIPSTTMAGPRRDMGWKTRCSGSTATASSGEGSGSGSTLDMARSCYRARSSRPQSGPWRRTLAT